jgi:riboflavin transporter FmnP
MTQFYIKRKSVFIAGTALLGAATVVLDVTFKMAGLKIPFPLFVDLKFDALGIPMLLAYFLFGFLSGAITSGIAFMSITLRSGQVFPAFMKFLAEFVTIVGVYVVLRTRKRSMVDKKWKVISMISGVALRVVVMDVANVLLLPIFTTFYTTPQAVIVIVPFISLFNAIQGAVSVFGGFLLYEAVILRLPSLRTDV